MSEMYRHSVTRMIKKSLMFLFLLLVTGIGRLYAQPSEDEQGSKAEEEAERNGLALLWETENGKKHGWVMEFLSADWKVVSMEQSCYYRFTFYFDGISYDPVIMNDKDYRIRFSGMKAVPRTGSPEALEGVYSIYGKDGSLMYEVIYTEGYRSGVHKIYREGYLQYEADFDNKPVPHQNYGYYLTGYNKDGSVRCQVYYDYKKHLLGNGCYIFPQ